MTLRLNCAALTAAAFAALATVASAAVSFTGSYADNFDEIGTTTTLPDGFTKYVGPSGTSNGTWSNSTGITAAGVAAMIANTAAMTVTTTPTTANNNGYNAAASAATTGDRVLATSPTGISGVALDLTLTNNTGAAISALGFSYDIIRYNAVSSANELPGYQVFVSLDGSTWTNLSAFNPTIDGAGGTVAVPNTAGTTNVSGTANLPSAWAAGATLDIRWVDDNAVQTSPDQTIGLNNVAINAVPEPTALVTGLAGIALLGFRRRAVR